MIETNNKFTFDEDKQQKMWRNLSKMFNILFTNMINDFTRVHQTELQPNSKYARIRKLFPVSVPENG